MDFVMLFLIATRRCLSVLPMRSAAQSLNRDLDLPFFVKARDTSRTWTRMRSRVLRRDRYRCRGCDGQVDEISLGMYQIHRGASDIEQMLTLCRNCRALANNLGLEGQNIPHFLRYLWSNLHRSKELTTPKARAE
jgi:hypothetical protein